MLNSASTHEFPPDQQSPIYNFKSHRNSKIHQLSEEHGDCITLAEKLATIAKNGDSAELAEGVKIVKEYNDTELEAHLQHEEQTILAPLVQHHREHIDLCIMLGKEHGYIRTLVEDMTPETAKKDLADLASILTRHTLVEEEELFPLIESLFTEEQLDTVLNFVPWR